MDKITHEVRLSQWKAIIKQCQARPKGVSARKWMEDNGIKSKQYYYWLRRVRKDAYDKALSSGLLPAAVKNDGERNKIITMGAGCCAAAFTVGNTFTPNITGFFNSLGFSNSYGPPSLTCIRLSGGGCY